MNDNVDRDEAEDILAFLVCLQDSQIPDGERLARSQCARHLVYTGSRRSIIFLSGYLVSLFERLPDDDPWVHDLGENLFSLLDVDLNYDGSPPLIHVMRVSGSLHIGTDSRHLIELARTGWQPTLSAIMALPDEDRFDILDASIRHLARRNHLYVGHDPRTWDLCAWLGAVPGVDESGLIKRGMLWKIPSGLYSAFSVAVPEIPF